MAYKLLTEASPKTVKGEKLGFLTGILYLAPAEASGQWNLCPNHTPGCAATCLYYAGRAAMTRPGLPNKILEARLRRTQLVMGNRMDANLALCSDASRLSRRARAKGLKPAIRLNGTSDLRWERILPAIFGLNDQTIFYDYTKDRERIYSFLRRELPPNYHLTYSLSEKPDDVDFAAEFLSEGVSVAFPYVVQGASARPTSQAGVERLYDALRRRLTLNPRLMKILVRTSSTPTVVNGDLHDLTFLYPPGSLIALRAKGRAIHDTSGFVLQFPGD